MPWLSNDDNSVLKNTILSTNTPTHVWRPATSPPPQVAAVIATALTPPEHLGLPFASWTLDRLAAYLHEHPGIAINPAAFDRHLCLFVEERREPIQRPARAWLIELLWARQRGRDDLRDLLRLRRDRPSGPRPILQTSEASRIEVFEPGADRDCRHVEVSGNRRYTLASTSKAN